MTKGQPIRKLEHVYSLVWNGVITGMRAAVVGRVSGLEFANETRPALYSYNNNYYS